MKVYTIGGKKMTQSPGEEFRDLLNKWDAVLLSEQSQLDTILNGNNFVLYFKKDGAIYGTPEEGRVTFARMKQPLDDTPKGWAKRSFFYSHQHQRCPRRQGVRDRYCL